MTKINVKKLPTCSEMKIDAEGLVGMDAKTIPQRDIETRDAANLRAMYGRMCRSERLSRVTGNYFVVGHMPIFTAAKRAEIIREAAAAERRKNRDNAWGEIVANTIFTIGGLVFIAASLGVGLAGMAGSITPSSESGSGDML